MKKKSFGRGKRQMLMTGNNAKEDHMHRDMPAM